MTFVENLRVGQWIAITHEEHPQSEWLRQQGYEPARRPCDGKPWQVLAISIPFIAVTDGIRMETFDSRYMQFTRLQRGYVRLVADAAFPRTLPSPTDTTSPRQNCCPHCGERLVRTRTADAIWIWRCRDCGFTNDDQSPIFS